MKKIEIKRVEILSAIKLSIMFGILRIIGHLFETISSIFIDVRTPYSLTQYLNAIILYCIAGIIFTLIYNSFAKVFGGIRLSIEEKEE